MTLKSITLSLILFAAVSCQSEDILNIEYQDYLEHQEYKEYQEYQGSPVYQEEGEDLADGSTIKDWEVECDTTEINLYPNN